MNPIERAQQAHQAGHACSQAVLEAFAPEYGLELETAQRRAAGFAGGMRQGRHLRRSQRRLPGAGVGSGRPGLCHQGGPKSPGRGDE